MQKPRAGKAFPQDDTGNWRMRLETTSTSFLRHTSFISWETPLVSPAGPHHHRSSHWRKSLPGEVGTHTALAWPPRPTGGALVSLSQLMSSRFLPAALLPHQQPCRTTAHRVCTSQTLGPGRPPSAGIFKCSHSVSMTNIIIGAHPHLVIEGMSRPLFQ